MFNKKCIFWLFCLLFTYYVGSVDCAVHTTSGLKHLKGQQPIRHQRIAEPPLRNETYLTTADVPQKSPSVVVRSATKSTTPARSTTTRNVASRSATSTKDTAKTITRGTSTVSSNARSGVSKKTTARVTSLPTISIKNASKTTTISKEDMEQYNEFLDYCKTQYSNCMDQYCDILNSDLGRCSCSANINNYSKTEEALEAANDALRDVAQQMQYIGLSATEIEVIFNETEAEAKMSDSKDSSQLKSDLDKIKKMIVDIQPSKATSGTSDTSGISMDLSGLLSFDFNADSFSLDSILGNTSNTESISNQRGAKLYKTAAARCKSNVLTFCKEKGIEEKLITNNYDIQIDKDCLTYEKFLKESNTNMSSTVRNAENVLHKARLAVHQNANTYDLAGCVSALDECMRSDFVCGSDYENCLDPSGKYIVNGEIVLGSDPMDVYNTWVYGDDDSQSPWDGGNLADYLDAKLWSAKPNTRSSYDMAEYLQYRIGYYDGEKNNGLCMGVLNQCQNYTYKKTTNATEKTFEYGNSVISEYLTRVLPEIKRKQDTILTDFAQNCTNEAKECLESNGWISSKDIATSSCYKISTTCQKMTQTVTDTSGIESWTQCLMNPDTCEVCENVPDNATPTSAAAPDGQCYWNCDAGYTLNGDKTKCELCANGSYKDHAGNDACTPCPEDEFTSNDRTSCETCAAGTYFSGNGCVTCGDNQYSDANAASCFPCPNGWTNSGSNASDHAGQSSCKKTITLNKNGGTGTIKGTSGTGDASVTCGYGVECDFGLASSLKPAAGSVFTGGWGTSSTCTATTTKFNDPSDTYYACKNTCSYTHATATTSTGNTCAGSCDTGYSADGALRGSFSEICNGTSCSCTEILDWSSICSDIALEPGSSDNNNPWYGNFANPYKEQYCIPVSYTGAMNGQTLLYSLGGAINSGNTSGIPNDLIKPNAVIVGTFNHLPCGGCHYHATGSYSTDFPMPRYTSYYFAWNCKEGYTLDNNTGACVPSSD